MPTLSSIAIPVISRSESAGFSSVRSRTPLHVKPRIYSDDPLPIQADPIAPRNARIVNRMFDDGVASFEIKIGETTIGDIGLDEILEYVSAYELEDYENRAFEQERELLKITEEEEERYRVERYERQKEKARMRGVAELRRSDTEEDEEMAIGKHGRARPSYKKLFKKQEKVRRRRKRDPVTGELMPLSDEDEVGLLQESSEDDRPVALPTTHSERAPLTQPVELPVRRRRKRDPNTGELLPLDPVSAAEGVDRQKRPRRRRHPITNELMPLGWRYDPDEDGRIDSSTDGSALPRNNNSLPSMNRLSLDHEQGPKRRRLDRSTDRAPRSRSPVVPLPSSPAKAGVLKQPKIKDALTAFKTGNNVIDLAGSDSDSADVVPVASQLPKQKPKLLRRSVGGAAAAQAASSQDSQGDAATSIMHPSANTISHNASSGDEMDDGEEQLDEDEYLIDSILSHHVSDTRTHPADFGKQPVMLYQVKWVGWDEPTWEPLSSFADLEVVRMYQRKVGMAVEPE